MRWYDAQFRIFLGATALKIILFQGYRSTDFEVHRNWLAITYSKPLSEWYTDATSEWTLDYPPLFAWFEWALAHAAKYADPDMLVVSNLEYESQATVIFQRGTVLVSELVLVSAAWQSCRRLEASGDRKVVASLLTFFLVVANAGIMMVDHVHFQYNGFLLGVLLWSCLLIEQEQDFAGGLLFAALLNLKHLFAYMAPVYFVYLLRHYCVGPRAFWRFCQMGLGVGLVFGVSFGPFIAMGQLKQVLTRLFPFDRGLIHSYWAANIWALYALADKVLAVVLPQLGQQVEVPTGHLAGGLVGVSRFAVLPQIAPMVTMLLVVAAMLPCLVALARHPRPSQFFPAIVYACLCGFVFGYHVHEKAILAVLIPLALQVTRHPRYARHFIMLSSAGHYALFPLLYQPAEYGFKLFYTLFYSFMLYKGVSWLLLARTVHGVTITSAARIAEETGPTPKLLSFVDWLYLCGFLPLEVFNMAVHPLWFGKALPFLPLLLTSVYCAVGVVRVWGEMMVGYVMGALGANKED